MAGLNPQPKYKGRGAAHEKVWEGILTAASMMMAGHAEPCLEADMPDISLSTV